MIVGKDSGTPTNNPATQWTGYGLSGDGGPYAFDGTTNACDGTFCLDMSDLSPDLGQQKRYFVGMSDSAATGSGQLKSYTLVDVCGGSETTVTTDANPNAFTPATGVADNATAWGFVDHSYGYIINFSGSPTHGVAPLTVTFTDSSLGIITNWFWNFGDGNTTNFATATNPVHTYNNAGTNTVSLKVRPAGWSKLIRFNYIVVLNRRIWCSVRAVSIMDRSPSAKPAI